MEGRDPGNLPIGVQIALTTILENVVRCFSIENSDFIFNRKIIEKEDTYTVSIFTEDEHWDEVEKLFNKFCMNYQKNPEFKYLAELSGVIPPKANQTEDTAVIREMAIQEFRNVFKDIRDKNLYILRCNGERPDFIDFDGVTLLSRNVVLVDNSDIFEHDDLILWYTFVLVHELCHFLRLKKSNFSAQKNTPEKFKFEAGDQMELELFGQVLHAEDVIEHLKSVKSPFKKGANVVSENRFRRCKILNAKAKLELFKKFIYPENAKVDLPNPIDKSEGLQPGEHK